MNNDRVFLAGSHLLFAAKPVSTFFNRKILTKVNKKNGCYLGENRLFIFLVFLFFFGFKYKTSPAFFPVSMPSPVVPAR
jgi:hypothetical protein